MLLKKMNIQGGGARPELMERALGCRMPRRSRAFWEPVNYKIIYRGHQGPAYKGGKLRKGLTWRLFHTVICQPWKEDVSSSGKKPESMRHLYVLYTNHLESLLLICLQSSPKSFSCLLSVRKALPWQLPFSRCIYVLNSCMLAFASGSYLGGTDLMPSSHCSWFLCNVWHDLFFFSRLFAGFSYVCNQSFLSLVSSLLLFLWLCLLFVFAAGCFVLTLFPVAIWSSPVPSAFIPVPPHSPHVSACISGPGFSPDH